VVTNVVTDVGKGCKPCKCKGRQARWSFQFNPRDQFRHLVTNKFLDGQQLFFGLKNASSMRAI